MNIYKGIGKNVLKKQNSPETFPTVNHILFYFQLEKVNLWTVPKDEKAYQLLFPTPKVIRLINVFWERPHSDTLNEMKLKKNLLKQTKYLLVELLTVSRRIARV